MQHVNSLQPESDGTVYVSGELVFDRVAALLTQSESLFSKEQPLTFDFSQVTRTDSAGVALLLQWLQQAKAASKKIIFVNLTEQMQTIIKVCGLEKIINNLQNSESVRLS